MFVRYAILSLLCEGPMHGYALREAVLSRYGFYREIDGSRVYRVLAALRAEKWVDRSPQREGRRPARAVHAITPSGRRELDRWLGHVPSVTGVDDLVSRLVLLGGFSDARLESALDEAIRANRVRREEFAGTGGERAVRNASDLIAALARAAMRDRANAERVTLERFRAVFDALSRGESVATASRRANGAIEAGRSRAR